jgi:hypothetical protein
MRLSANREPKSELVGNAEPVCPYCSEPLDRMPGRKKKCTSCGNYMYVRTRPADRKKVILTKQALDQIEPLWSMVYDAQRACIADEDTIGKEKAALSTKTGRQSSDRDAFWSLCNKQLLEEMKKGNWGLYRNTRFSMAQLLICEGRHRAALDTLMEVSYLDANGPRNMSGVEDPEIVRKFPPFTPKDAFQAPAIVESIETLADWLDLTPRDLKEAYSKVTERLYKDMNLPVSPQDGWNDLEFEFSKIG